MARCRQCGREAIGKDSILCEICGNETCRRCGSIIKINKKACNDCALRSGT